MRELQRRDGSVCRERCFSFFQCFIDFFCDFLFNSSGEFGAFADELTLRDADVVGASGVGGALVVGGGVWEVGMDDDGAVADGELDGTAEVAGGACEDGAGVGGAVLARGVEPTLDLFPCATEETLLLEIVLKHTDGEVADLFGDVGGQFALQADGEVGEILVKFFECHAVEKWR